MLNQNRILIGLICGIVVPFIAYALIITIYDFGDSQGWFDGPNVTDNFRARSQALFAIAANLITINVFRRKKHENSMRGVVIATAIYIFAWIAIYANTFFN